MHMLQRKVLALAPLTARTFSRSISFTCRGEPIQYEQLFEYTNGRFLVNERAKRQSDMQNSTLMHSAP
ncbi:hypothetical protein RU639_002650 [Aspergillus parasiticus]